jgi:hypothetical protein
MTKKIPMPTDGKGPMMTTGGGSVKKPAQQLDNIKTRAPQKGSGSDTSPYSSARRSRG